MVCNTLYFLARKIFSVAIYLSTTGPKCVPSLTAEKERRETGEKKVMPTEGRKQA
jgi:hypothetical protein